MGGPPSQGTLVTLDSNWGFSSHKGIFSLMASSGLYLSVDKRFWPQDCTWPAGPGSYSGLPRSAYLDNLEG